MDAAITAVMDRSTFPDRQAWAQEYLRAVNSDADAIAAFTPERDRPG